jgi:hypothetical protein
MAQGLMEIFDRCSKGGNGFQSHLEACASISSRAINGWNDLKKLVRGLAHPIEAKLTSNSFPTWPAADYLMDKSVNVGPELRRAVVKGGVSEIDANASDGGTDSPVLLRVIQI